VQLGDGFKSILRNGAYLFGTNAWTALLRVVYLVFLTRFLGPDNYGIWAYAIATYVLTITAGNFGLEVLSSVRIGARKQGARHFLDTCFTMRILLLLAFSMLLALYAFLIEDAGPVRLAILIGIPGVWGRGLAVWVRTVMTGMERADIAFRAGLATRSAEVVLGVVLLWLGNGVQVLLILHAVMWVIEAAVLFLALRGLNLFPRFAVDRRMIRGVLSAGFALGAAVWLNSLLANGPIVIARQLVSDLGELGQIAITFQMAGLFYSLSLPFLNAALPVLSRSTRSGDQRARHFGPLVAGGAIAITGIGAVLVHFFGLWAMDLVFGAKFATAAEMLGPAVVVAGLMIAPTGFNHYLVVLRRRWETVIANGLAVVCLFVAAPLLFNMMGSVGILFGAAAGLFIRVVLLASFALRAAGATREAKG